MEEEEEQQRNEKETVTCQREKGKRQKGDFSFSLRFSCLCKQHFTSFLSTICLLLGGHRLPHKVTLVLTSPKENRRFAYSSVYMEMDKDRAISKVTFHLIGGLESGDTDIGSTDCSKHCFLIS